VSVSARNSSPVIISGASERMSPISRPIGPGSVGMIAGDHDHSDTGLTAFAQRFRHLETRRILEPGQSREDEVFLHPCALPVVLQSLGR
jgi:hypothetical protein